MKMMAKGKGTLWEKTFAGIWTNYVPPARPSCAEIALYTRYVRKLQKKTKEPIELLILGSTPEFRDWGYQEGMNVTVVDYNRENYDVLGTFLRHKRAVEHFIESDWRSLDFHNTFDLIVGDHAMGVLPEQDVPKVLENVAQALRQEGFFMTKQYLRSGKRERTVEAILGSYKQKFSNFNIQNVTVAEIVNSCASRNHGLFDFKKALKEIEIIWKRGILSEDEYQIFENLNWANMKFNLFVPTRKQWEHMLKPFFKIYKVEHSEDIYSKKTPIYILQKML